MNKLVIYHGNCYDGVTAAWIAYRALDPAFEGMTSAVEYRPLNYSDPPPDVKGKDVYIIDFSFKCPVMKQIIKDAEYVTVLDHHKTAQFELEEISAKNCTIIFDMERSGAGIAWDYFFKGIPRPLLVNYIEDRDLWRFKLPDSKEINAWIQSFDIDLNTWIHTVGPQFELLRAKKEGVALRRLEDKYVKQICANAKVKEIVTPEMRVYRGPYVQTSILMSEVCDFLINNFPGNFPFAFYSFRRKDGKVQYGLRSRSDFDVSEIAKQFGGGGHKQAAGFELDKEL